MKKLITALVTTACSWIFTGNSCQAQYTTGIGIRAAKVANGINVKHFLSIENQVGLEFYGGYTREAHGGYFGKLFLIKQASISKSNIPFPLRYIFRQSRLQIPLKFVYGAGVHAGYFEKRYYAIRSGEVVRYANNTMSMGVDVTCGLEYNTRKLPVTIGIDITPYYSFINPGPEWLDMGVNVRYVFR